MIGVQILLLGNENPKWLKECYNSLENQDCTIYKQSAIFGNTNQARIDGYLKIKEDWISFVDPDDLVAPNAFTEISKAIKNNPEASIIATDEIIINGDGVQIGEGAGFGSDITPELIRKYPRTVHHLVCYKKDVLYKVKDFALSRRQGIEWSMSYAASTLGKVVKISKPLYSWRKHTKQAHKNRIVAVDWIQLKKDLDKEFGTINEH